MGEVGGFSFSNALLYFLLSSLIFRFKNLDEMNIFCRVVISGSQNKRD